MSNNIYIEIDDHLKGYARVKLDHIEFETCRDLDERNVKRLLKNFRLQGCRREDPANAIPVVVGGDLMSKVLMQQGLHSLTLRSFVPTQLPYITGPVICLHGKHRIFAAQSFLRETDRWWTVKVFDSSRRSRELSSEHALTETLGLPLHAREYIRYEYSNTLKPSDGNVFRHHLNAERRGDRRLADAWMAMLWEGKQKRVCQLKKLDHGRLLNALLPLLPFAALWDDYKLGSLNRELPLRCLEVCHAFERPRRIAEICNRNNTAIYGPFTKSGVKYWALI